MTAAHPLDRPVWASLNARWRDITVGDAATALRLPPQYWPLGAPADASPGSLDALAQLVGPQDRLSLIEPEPVTPPGCQVESLGITQMVADVIHGPEPTFGVIALGQPDAAEMLALADLTKPGPFSIDTWRLGRFIGMREGDRLIAMAGERMGLPGYGELSGVCTAPDHRGRGYAAGLMRLVGRRILARGEQVFLHAHTHNAGAIALYETLGFRARRELVHLIVGRD